MPLLQVVKNKTVCIPATLDPNHAWRLRPSAKYETNAGRVAKKRENAYLEWWNAGYLLKCVKVDMTQHVVEKTYKSEQPVCEQRTKRRECRSPARERWRNEGWGGESPYASPDANFADVAGYVGVLVLVNKRHSGKCAYFGCLDNPHKPLVMNFSSWSLFSRSRRHADF